MHRHIEQEKGIAVTHPGASPQTPSAPFARPLAALALLFAAALLLFPALASADSSFGEYGTGAGQLFFPAGVAVSRQNGDVYVADQGNQRIDQFDAAGAFIRAFGWEVNAEIPEAKLQECTTATGCQQGSIGSGPGQFEPPTALAVDNDPASPSYGDLWVADRNNARVEKFGPSGAFLLTLGGGVNKTTGADLCTAASGNTCGAGVEGPGSAQFQWREGSGSAVTALAVGRAGLLYVGDVGRVQTFEAGGAFAGEFALNSATLPAEALAVDDSCLQQEPPLTGSACEVFDPAAGDLYVHQDNVENVGRAELAGVQRYDSSGAYTGATLDPTGKPNVLAVDRLGDLIVGDEAGGEYKFRQYNSAAVLFAVFGSAQLLPNGEHGYLVPGVAVGDATGELYAANATSFGLEQRHHVAVIAPPQPGPPAVTEEEATDVEPTTATLRAIVNPSGFDTKYRFQYVTVKHFQEEGFEHAEETTLLDLGIVNQKDPVQTAISPLTTNTAYRWRVLAESECEPEPKVHPGQFEHCVTEGADETFETLPPVSVRDFTTQTVGPELVTFKVELDNNNSLQAGHYTIHYGAQAGSYSAGTSEGTLPAGSSTFEARQATFTGLQPDTTYHYQLLAENSYTSPGHLVETPDQTFTTEPSAAEEHAGEHCPNTILREENSSLALPDCRAYERVSAAFKGGAPVSPRSALLAPSGERALYFSVGAFAGATQDTPPLPTQYLARRTTTGWITQAMVGNPAGPGYLPLPTENVSPELDRWVFLEVPQLSSEQFFNSSTGAYYMGFADGTFKKASPTIGLVEGEPRPYFMPVRSSSDALSRLFIVTGARLLPAPGDPRPDFNANTNVDRIYEVSDADGPAPSIRLLAENPVGLPDFNACSLDGEAFNGGRRVSTDGSTIAYTLPIKVVPGAGCGVEGPNPIGVFAHTGEATIQLNVPPAAQCHSPSPCASGANAVPRLTTVSPDGSRVWFTTAQPLVDSDKDSTRDLYLAKLENGELAELVQASRGESGPGTADGNGAGLQGVVQVSPDGSHVAFVATGVLTTEPNSTGVSAAQGADNLYLYNAESAETRFVASLCSDPGKSGSFIDSRCPTTIGAVGAHRTQNDRSLWDQEAATSESHLTPNGDFLVFNSFGRLAPGDTDNVQDLYRYDFHTGQLIRVSFGRDGNDGNGNDDAYAVELPESVGGSGGSAELAEDSGRSISADGATVIFKTSAPLVSHDTNTGPRPSCGGFENQADHSLEPGTGCDIYQWQEQGHGSCTEVGGCVSLVSDGRDPRGVSAGNISSSGRDITFITGGSLVSADTDGIDDVYDARENGGFHQPTEPKICTGNEICHHEPSAPPLPPKITSEGETGGNGPQQLQCAKGKVRVTKHGQVRCVPKKHHAKKHHKRVADRNRGGQK